MPTTVIRCPNCRKNLRSATEISQGARIRCPGCNHRFVVGSAGMGAAPKPPSPPAAAAPATIATVRSPVECTWADWSPVSPGIRVSPLPGIFYVRTDRNGAPSLTHEDLLEKVEILALPSGFIHVVLCRTYGSSEGLLKVIAYIIYYSLLILVATQLGEWFEIKNPDTALGIAAVVLWVAAMLHLWYSATSRRRRKPGELFLWTHAIVAVGPGAVLVMPLRPSSEGLLVCEEAVELRLDALPCRVKSRGRSVKFPGWRVATGAVILSNQPLKGAPKDERTPFSVLLSPAI